MKKIYIAGCGGMLGEAFHKVFGKHYELKCTDIDLNESWLGYCDIRFIEDYRKDVEEFAPDYLFHLGALTDLEICEGNGPATYLTNTIGVENAVLIANELNIPLLYISTAGIFDGEQRVYDDWDTPNPIGAYGRSKYMGERYVVENAKKYLVCRAGWMMGGGPMKDKKFIGKLMKQINGGAKELFVVNDKFGTPTYTYDFANTVEVLLIQEYWGLYNCVCKGTASRLDVALELVKILGIGNEVKITPVTSDYFGEDYFAKRPESERLLTSKLDMRGIRVMRDWEDALMEYVREWHFDTPN